MSVVFPAPSMPPTITRTGGGDERRESCDHQILSRLQRQRLIQRHDATVSP